jgi:hypothetical protein
MKYAFYYHFWAGYVVFYRHDKHDENDEYESWHQETFGT